MRRIAAIIGVLLGALGVNVLLFAAIGAMNLSASEKPVPGARTRYRLFSAARLSETRKPRRETAAPPKAAPPVKSDRSERAKSRKRRTRPQGRRFQPLRPPPTSGIGGGALVSRDLFESGILNAAPAPVEDTAPETRVAPPREVRVRELDHPPRALKKPLPEFPDWASERGVTGTVTLSFRVTLQGKTEDIRVLRWTGDEDFGDAARRAVAQWRFAPGTREGRPVAFRCRVTIRFEE